MCLAAQRVTPALLPASCEAFLPGEGTLESLATCRQECRRYAPAWMITAIAGLFFTSGCSRQDATVARVDGSRPAQPISQTASNGAIGFTATLPQAGGPAGYVGSKSCRSCHV